jgi:hypothetical protein
MAADHGDVRDAGLAQKLATVERGLCRTSVEYMFAGHVSGDGGHHLMMESLGLQPLLELGLRLGEGTGAALAMTINARGQPVSTHSRLRRFKIGSSLSFFIMSP